MSNGMPEPAEGGPEGPPGLIVMIALAYSILWILLGFGTLLFDLTWIIEQRWLVWSSVVLLVAAIYILARELRFLGPPPGLKRR